MKGPKDVDKKYLSYLPEIFILNEFDTYLTMILLRDLASNQIRLINSLFVISPFLVPYVLIFESFDKYRLLLVLKPKLTVCFNSWLDAINHS